HGQRVDVEAAAGDEPREAGEHTRLVLDEDGQRVAAHASSPSSSSPAQSGRMSRAYSIWSLLTPAATIGHPIASAGTTKSMTTGRSLMSRARWTASSTSSLRVTRMPSQPYASASFTKSGTRTDSWPVLRSEWE